MKTINYCGKYVKVDEILKWIECNLVMPFEGSLQSENNELTEIHSKITDYNRTKFNQLTKTFEEHIIEGENNGRT